ncbi:IS110 family transposase [Clostridium sporogenes]|uniref:Transposase IS116/IS110/IS902 family protein n=2 Tax=Clostridium cochlearium TaxID=1494 RepID=A0ABY0QP51_CLOCO|nr:IS110 family transposase [Clostridium cochlearium]MBV1821366.1 IS110 family transposase [Bacteroidales bacterium MSK.15.36]SDK88684.1 Transposase IS116/IS110/IS902 family protein [Clostridium cochlearium]SDL42169.1 Transposase IS116/IS110/IS902 family protein [Clostridium cochlearium]SDL44762.1 Transposase IS116/IS110/IS902 family protein [Clostridium cochlearium]
MKNNFMSTLFVGIDVSSKTNVLCALDFAGNKLLNLQALNNQPGAQCILDSIINCLNSNSLKHVVIALESTSFYSTHIANFLSSKEELMPFKPLVYCLNPKTVANYRKSFVDMDKTDPLDAYIIADFARVGRITCQPWRGAQFLALQRLSRHRLHLVECITREKTYMVSNIYLKFSQLAVLDKEDRPFSNTYGTTCAAVLTEFLSLDDIVYSSIEDLVVFVSSKGKNRFKDPLETAKLLQKAARDSYRLDKVLYEPLNTSIASSFNLIKAFSDEIKSIDKAIEKTIKGLNTTEFKSLTSIPGIGPVLASGIIAEIGTITSFNSHNALAKYAGLTWRVNQSGNYSADDTRMTKTGNKYLRYYLIEAANSVKNHIPEYKEFYNKKYGEVTTHQHKRALALTSRKLVRLIFGLLTKNQLYSSSKVGDNQ